MTTINSPDRKLDNPKSKHLYSNSIRSQQARILKHFEQCPRLSTLQARHEYGILHPGGRIMELRKMGYNIDTHWVEEPDANGELHRVGLYVYLGKVGGHHGNNKYTNLFNLVQCLHITVDSLNKAIQLAERLPSERYNAGMFLFKMCLMVHSQCIKRIEIEHEGII